MGEYNLGQATASDLDSTYTDYSVDAAQTDGATGEGEFEWTNADFNQWLGYYKEIPELSAVIDAKATWTVGKGVQTDPNTQFILDTIKGFGKDTFNTILENMIRTYHIGGDAFCERITDKDGELINLKPLDPGTIKIVTNAAGRIKRYEQESKTKSPNKKWKPEDIFHLARNRVADEVHGQSITEKLVNIILMKNEAMDDWKRVLHRNVDPVWIFHLDTDDSTKIAAFKNKFDALRGDKEGNLYIPKDAVIPELVSTATNAVLSPLAWIESLDAKFYEAAQVPKIIVGGSGGFTEAAVKIAYLAFQQTIEEEQLFIEEQVGLQLGLAIELEFPASLENELLSDNKKDGAVNIDQSETTQEEVQV